MSTSLVLASLLGLASAHCRGADRAALKQLYEVLDGASWLRNDGWNVTDVTPGVNLDYDPCSTTNRWHGVGFLDPCDRWKDDIVKPGTAYTTWLTEERGAGAGCFAGRVTSLSLPHNGLAGPLSGADLLGALANLTALDLGWNALEGTLPPQLGKLANIQSLRLARNNLSGTVPAQLGRINADGPAPRDACGPDRTAPCPLPTNLKLTDLSLEHNRFSGSVPSQLGELSHLRRLVLAHNSLSGQLPATLGKLAALQLFSARHNALGGSLPAALFGITNGSSADGDAGEGEGGAGGGGAAAMPQLRYLLLEHNLLGGALPTALGHLAELSELHASHNRLEGPLPSQVGNLPILASLHLAHNSLNGSLPSQLGRLGALRELDVYANQMTGAVPSQIGGLTNVASLYLDNQHLKPVRQHYCGQRIANTGKYNWRLLREEYQHWTATVCPEAHERDTEFTFNSLQASSMWDATE